MGPEAGGHSTGPQWFLGVCVVVKVFSGPGWGLSGPQVEIQVESPSQQVGALGLGTTGESGLLEHLRWTQLRAGIFL